MSDQDFFFEEEPKVEAKKKTPASKEALKSSKSTGTVAADVSGGFELNYTIVALIAVVSLLVGLIGGIFIGKSLTPPVVESSVQPDAGGTNMMDGGAPQLTNDQMQQGMPAGHPAVGGDGAAEDKPAGDKKTDDKAEEKSAE